MSLALYRKYRPQKWQDLTGQNHIKITLQHEVESGKITHAYLFTGPRGIGKTTTARLLAKSVNCEKRKEGESEPCNSCDSCLELTVGNDLDILEIDAASHTGVDNVRENIIANARFTPVKRKFKVFIIDEVHMLSISAFNALLKILEEPPAHAIFILATTEVHKVPATIISRCQRFDFRKVNSDDLNKRLIWICQQEGVKITKDVLAEITRYSEGCLRDAESLLGQILALGEKEITMDNASLVLPRSNFKLVIELVNNLVYKNLETSISLINKLADEGVDLVRYADDLIEFLRKIMLSKISSGLKSFAFDLDEQTEKTILDLSGKFEINDLVYLINLLAEKKLEIKSAPIPQLPLEIAVIEYCQGKEKTGGQGGERLPTKGPDTPSQSENKKNSPPGYKLSSANSEETKKGGANNTTLKNSNSAAKARDVKKIGITLDEIKAKWHNFLVRLQNYNASLVFILKVAEPLELNDNVLKIGFKYPFHQQRIRQAKICEAVEKVLKEFFNEEIYMDTCILPPSYESTLIKQETKADEVELVDEIPSGEALDQQALIETLIKTFNGKVVE
ncbi:MAG: DNA polymerase III, subunit gamma and tau [Candidatus Buchananbacteria bacterium RBG_13_39_9]|uniref:DNA polymerase III subunit gamma/tau n=1 Tax=Candidatus Buchananbacteria bacterium RBG_13_39_9 TaxID=1797531 RepID=A0A1G1XQE7_9BACT|nr:MAG: DNA polymerase III, subunit gamma and tau [Candidatus Buchananbacteria bacterium RBG_13_39_9]